MIGMNVMESTVAWTMNFVSTRLADINAFAKTVICEEEIFANRSMNATWDFMTAIPMPPATILLVHGHAYVMMVIMEMELSAQRYPVIPLVLQTLHVSGNQHKQTLF